MRVDEATRSATRPPSIVVEAPVIQLSTAGPSHQASRASTIPLAATRAVVLQKSLRRPASSRNRTMK